VGYRRWYPDRFDVEAFAHRLAVRLFPRYEDLPAGAYFHAPIRDVGLLESALARVREPYYRTTIDKAGALLRSMVKNHPFVDGNKRLGMATTFLVPCFNRYLFVPSNEDMVSFALELAKSDPPMSWQQVADWIRRNTLSIRTQADRQRALERADLMGQGAEWIRQMAESLIELHSENQSDR
jgi:death-on-curing protein